MRTPDHSITIAEDWDIELRNPNNWLPVSSAELPESKRKKFKARKRALELRLCHDMPINQIVRNTGVSKTELYRIIDRAFKSRVDGQPIGYLACVPGYRIKQYERTTSKPSQKAGRMTQFLSQNPDVKKQLDDWILGKKLLGNSKVRGKQSKKLWLEFTKLCKGMGIDTEAEYPFTNKDGGREAIRRYSEKLRQQNFVSAATVIYGDEVGRLAKDNGVRVPENTNIPYERVLLDGHRIDAIFTALIPDADGNVIELPLSRIWLLVLIDIGSRCVLGYHISLSENYTSEDVLSCIASSVTPWEPRELPEHINAYQNNAGLPSGVIDACKWRIFNSLQMDNAFSHLSAWVQERILHAGALEVVTNKPKSPRSDAIVERFMKTFEETSFHLWPNTVGSNPKDPRRRNPEKSAARLCLGIDEMRTAVDLAIAKYNVTAHTSLHGRSPLEYLRFRLSKGLDLVRYSPERTIDGLRIFDREYQVKINANLKQGHKPYIKFLGVRYTDDWLRARSDLAEIKATLRVNTKDIRTGLIFLPSGECLGMVSAEAKWMAQTHSISTRRAVLRLIRDQKLFSESYDPVSDYLEYLAQQAPLTRKARNKLIANELDCSENNNDNVKPSIPMKTNQKKHYRGNWVSLTKTVTR